MEPPEGSKKENKTVPLRFGIGGPIIGKAEVVRDSAGNLIANCSITERPYDLEISDGTLEEIRMDRDRAPIVIGNISGGWIDICSEGDGYEIVNHLNKEV